MRALRVVIVVGLLLAGVLFIALNWLVRSEQGSSWLVQQGLAYAPIAIEVSGLSGNLFDGLDIAELSLQLPAAEVRAEQLSVRWQPAQLFTGRIYLTRVLVSRLAVVLRASPSTDEPMDPLGWLDIPVDIEIADGQIDQLQIELVDAQTFEVQAIKLQGRLGQGRLIADSLAARSAGVEIQLDGSLEQQARESIRVNVSWALPSTQYSGTGEINGNFDTLRYEHALRLPDEIMASGTISDVLVEPALVGAASWRSVRVLVEQELQMEQGELQFTSDFRKLQFEGNSKVSFAGMPAGILQITALMDFQQVVIQNFALQGWGGAANGSGQFSYGDAVQGQLELVASGIDMQQLQGELPGRLDFSAQLQLDADKSLAITIPELSGEIYGQPLTGAGSARLQAGELQKVIARVTAGANEVFVDVNFGEQLKGAARFDLNELEKLSPDLSGTARGEVVLGGTTSAPEVIVSANGSNLEFRGVAASAVTLKGGLQGNGQLTGALRISEMASGETGIGELAGTIAGTLAEHRLELGLDGKVLQFGLEATGGWDGTALTERLNVGRFRPAELEQWQLAEQPTLRVTSAGGTLEPHCWKQAVAGICFGPVAWGPEQLQSSVSINGFELAALEPLLADGYRIDGKVDGEIELVADAAGTRGVLHWRQGRTDLSYSDEIDSFQTVVDALTVKLVTDNDATVFDALLTGEAGLNVTATALIDGPLLAASKLQAGLQGNLPSIGLLRPLLQRSIGPTELEGALKIDLGASGTLGDPVFSGGANLTEGLLGLTELGVTLSEITLAAVSAQGDELQLSGRLRSGDGIAEITGVIGSDDAETAFGLVADVRVQGENMAIVRIPDLSVNASPDLRLQLAKDRFDITGALLLPYARAQLRELPESVVPRSTDVVIHGATAPIDTGPETPVTASVSVTLGEDVRFNGFGLDSRLEGALKLQQGREGALRNSGTVRLRNGFLVGYGRELRVDRGELTFTRNLDDPLINIQVSREAVHEGRQYTIGLRLTGSAQNIQTEAFSRPSLSEQDVLSFLLLDRPTDSGSGANAAALALGLRKFVPSDGGMLGLDEVSFETNSANQAAMVAGKRINERLYVRYVFGTIADPGAFRIRYRLARGFSLEASTGAQQALDLIYLLER